MSRVSFLSHKGEEILYIDFSKCQEHEAAKLATEVKQLVSRRPKRSSLTLTNVTDMQYNSAAVYAVQDMVVSNRPHVKASAVIGIKGFKTFLLEGLSRVSGGKFSIFKDLDKAKDWLVEELRKSD